MKSWGTWAVAAALSALPAFAEAQIIPPQESCPGVLTSTPDLSMCFGGAVLGGELAVLSTVDCVVGKINQWQTKQLECLQTRVERVHATVMYPDALKREIASMARLLRAGRTLKQEVESLACGWRFSPRTGVLRDLYVKPIKLCKPSFQAVFGEHRASWNADLHEMFDWTSATTHNLIQERTVGPDPGVHQESPAGTEYTWQRIADENARALVKEEKTPGRAIRFAAQLSSDTLRVQASTHQLQTQGLLVEQQARDYRERKRSAERGLGVFIVQSWSKASAVIAGGNR